MARNGNLKGPSTLPRPSNLEVSPLEFVGIRNGSSPSSSTSVVVDGRSQALKVHSQAGRRRRERISEHLSTLRCMITDTRKMDKATLLGSVIAHVKDPKREAVDINKSFSIPAAVDEMVIEARGIDDAAASENRHFYLKASICCDDRPGLFADLLKAFRGLRLTTVGADITSSGGRAKNVFVPWCGKSHGNGSVGMSSLKENVKDALAKVASLDSGSSEASSSKRQRLPQSYCS